MPRLGLSFLSRLLTTTMLAGSLVLGMSVPAYAYEYQQGDSAYCPEPHIGASVIMGGYGDSNLYSSYRREAFVYNVSYNQYVQLSREIYERSTASAADSENYVTFVDAGCWPYD